MHNLDEVLKQLESQQKVQQAQQAQEQNKEEIFKEKKYWCRYFDYSNGRDPENVIMQYDRSCKLYNIFEISGPPAAQTTPAQTSSSAASSSKGSSTKPQVLDISGIKSKSSDLKNN